MSDTHRNLEPASPDLRSQVLIAIAISIALLLPLFPLPRPVNVSSIPWKAELAFSICLLAGLIVCRRAFDPRSNPKSVTNTALLAAAVGLLSLVSVLWAVSWFAALHSSFSWLTYAVLLVFTFQLARSRSGLILRVFTATSLILGALIFFDFVTLVDVSTQEGVIRIRYAKFAELLVTLSPILFAIAIYKRSGPEFLKAIIPGVVAWATVMLSLSKGAFLSGIIGFLGFFVAAGILSKSRFRKKLVAAFIIWIAVTAAVQAGFTLFSSVPSTAEYITGDADATRSTTSMRLFDWKLTFQMIKDNPLIGVGADNFGIALNPARASYAASNPDSTDLAIGEDYIFERAHNEPLQILAELGVLGFLFFAAFVIYAAYHLIGSMIGHRGRCSPIFIAAKAGCAAFAISSLFSSFSFRAFQNGVVFFAVLGIAFAFSPAHRRRKIQGSVNGQKPWFAVSIACVTLLLVYSGSKGFGHYFAFFAERADSTKQLESLFSTSLLLDQDLPGSYLGLAGQAAKRGDHAGAAACYRKAIDGGLGISQIYSYLADSYQKANDPAAAEAALREGISIFPRSMFLRARLAQVLTNAGRSPDATQELELARQIDAAQANGWHTVLSEGILAAHLKAQTDTSYAKPPDLRPAGAIALYTGGIDQLPGASP